MNTKPQINPRVKGVEISIAHIEDVEHVTFNRISYKRVGSTTYLIQVHDTKEDTYQLISEHEFTGAKEDVLDPEAAKSRRSQRRTSRHSRAMLPILGLMTAGFGGMHVPSPRRGGRR